MALYHACINKVIITIEPPIKALLEGYSLSTIHANNVPNTVPSGKNIATSGAGIYRGAIVIKLNEMARTTPLENIYSKDWVDMTNESATKKPIIAIKIPFTAIAGTIFTLLYFLKSVKEKPPITTDSNAKRLPNKFTPLVSPAIII